MPIDYQVDGRIAIFTLNHPEAHNAIDVRMFKQLHD